MPEYTLVPTWEFVADTVMGGVSTGQVTSETLEGREAARLTGRVSLDNNGGFVQMAFDVNPDGSGFDASAYHGLEMAVWGNGECYDLRLRTSDLARPWQSYRTSFVAPKRWTSVKVPFSEVVPHKTDVAFNPSRLRRIGILAIGRVFEADVAVALVRLV